MQTNAIQLTKEGLEKLKAELKDLIDNKRPEVARRIQIARENGDISENAEYDSARQEQGTVEGRIEELEDIIKKAVISNKGNNKDIVGLGCIVKVHIDGDEEVFQIVGAPEANPMEKKISHESPLGKSLTGKKVGDTIEVQVPVGKISYKILSIEY